MNDNIILYAISLICIILLLIEWIFISHKKCSVNAIVFVGYSFPLYYLMIYKGAGGAAFTWWFYLVLFTSIHVIILLIILFYFFISRRRANERKQRCDKWNEGCAFFWVTLACRCVIFTSLWPSILQMVYIGTPAFQRNEAGERVSSRMVGIGKFVLFSTSTSKAFWMESNNCSMSLLVSTASLLLFSFGCFSALC